MGSELSPRIFLGTEKASSLRGDIYTFLYFNPFDPQTGYLQPSIRITGGEGSLYAIGEMTGGTGGVGA
jgi:hypothetical protein